MVKLSRCLIEYDNSFKNICNDTWNKASKITKKNLIANLRAIKNFRKPKSNLTVMKLQIFTMKKGLKWALVIPV